MLKKCVTMLIAFGMLLGGVACTSDSTRAQSSSPLVLPTESSDRESVDGEGNAEIPSHLWNTHYRTDLPETGACSVAEANRWTVAATTYPSLPNTSDVLDDSSWHLHVGEVIVIVLPENTFLFLQGYNYGPSDVSAHMFPITKQSAKSFVANWMPQLEYQLAQFESLELPYYLMSDACMPLITKQVAK